MKHIILFLFIISLFSCQDNKNSRAFYYWQTNGYINEEGDSLARLLNVTDWYYRCFDVEWSFGYEDAIPRAPIHYYDNDLEKRFNVIPTVFIINRVFKHIKADDLDLFADRIIFKIPNSQDSLIHEIQIDCDWTANTKDQYFKFLKILKSKLQPWQKLSVTIRLHQYRDRKLMGIPPVDRGMLMVYNVADPKNHQTKNSILDVEIVKQYVKDKRYPLELDIALPLFYWGVWYRNHQFKGILSGWDMTDANDKTTYQASKNHFYSVKVDTVIQSHYLREGDVIRLDGSFEEEMEPTIQWLKEKINPKNARITFFDWNTEKIIQHETQIQNYYRRLD